MEERVQRQVSRGVGQITDHKWCHSYLALMILISIQNKSKYKLMSDVQTL